MKRDTLHVKRPDGSTNRYAKLFRVLAALALVMPPLLLSLALSFYFVGSVSIAPSIMSLAFVSSFICIFTSLIVALSASILWIFGVVQFRDIRLAAALGLLGFVTNYFVFVFLLHKFYRPH